MSITLKSLWKIGCKAVSWLWLNRKIITEDNITQGLKVELYSNDRWKFFLEIQKIDRRTS
jgi:hypothetical protein